MATASGTYSLSVLISAISTWLRLQSLKHQRKWKSDPNYTKSWYDRGAKTFHADKYRKGACENSPSEFGTLYDIQ